MHTDSRTALGAVFGAIKTLMMWFISLVQVADDGTTMLQKAVADAKERQTARSDYDMVRFHQTLEAEMALQLEESRRKIEEYINRSPEHRESYMIALKDLQEGVAARRAQRMKGAET